MPPNSTDAALVAAFQAGDAHAFELLFARHRPALLRYAAGRLGAGEAEDIVQDAMLRAHRALSRGTTPAELEPWLYVIVRNVCIDCARASARRPTAELHDHDGEAGADPADVVIGRQRFAAVVRAINGLPPRQRDALVGVELGDRSYDEVADAADTSPAAVKSLINRARVTVRNATAAAVAVPPLLMYRLRDALTWLRDAPEALAGAALGKAGIAAVSAVSAVAVVTTVPTPLKPATPEEHAELSITPVDRHGAGAATRAARPPAGRPAVSHAGGRSPVAMRSAPVGGGTSVSAMRDCAAGRPLGRRYSLSALEQARHDLPADVSEYTTCDDDLRRAMLNARA